MKAPIKKAATVAVLVAALGLAAGCAPQSVQPDQAAAQQGGDAVQVAWSPDMDCASCHAVEEASASDASCLASKHPAATCESCHGVADSLATAHANATATAEMPKKLSKENAVPEDTCLSCHGGWDDLAAKTADVDVLTDADGTTVNPHAMDRTGDHSSITCTSCHTVHEVEDDQKQLCLSCHHEDVFECRTCHE
ncbi:cytochrome c3 family protein [Arabiibacter massiliensis]|uniref:cytochrome c3 family protein n=1 Tax=Arabiibacter massiliensis TaxID=1870985 RepID=UPI001E59E48C|nr:cytochrome c3 family protein [Arabiibacter massiliensis]